MSTAVAQPVMYRKFGTDLSNNLNKPVKVNDGKKEVKKKAEKPKPVVIPVVSPVAADQEAIKKTAAPSTPGASPKETPRVYCKEYLLLFREVCKDVLDCIPEEIMMTGAMEKIEFMKKPIGKKYVPRNGPATPSTPKVNDPKLKVDIPASPAFASTKSPKDKRELDARRLAQRQKQIAFGHNTLGYKIFMALPVEARIHGTPREPEIYQVCSKRSWDGQVRKWRRELHAYDPTPTSIYPDHLERLISQWKVELGEAGPMNDDLGLDDDDSEGDVQNLEDLEKNLLADLNISETQQ